MPIDWDQIDREIAERDKATSSSIARKVSSLSALSEQEAKTLFPTQGDVQEFARLMKRVAADSDSAANAAWLTQNINRLAPTVLRVLKLMI